MKTINNLSIIDIKNFSNKLNRLVNHYDESLLNNDMIAKTYNFFRYSSADKKLIRMLKTKIDGEGDLENNLEDILLMFINEYHLINNYISLNNHIFHELAILFKELFHITDKEIEIMSPRKNVSAFTSGGAASNPYPVVSLDTTSGLFNAIKKCYGDQYEMKEIASPHIS